jgi:WD40 repeat protein
LSVVETKGRRIVQTERWQLDGKLAGNPAVLETGERGIMAAAFGPAGRFAVAPRQDDAGAGEILIFKLGDNRPEKTLTRTGATPRAIAFSPDKRMIAVAGQAEYIELWEEADGNWERKESDKLRPPLDPSDSHDLTALAFSPDSRFLASADELGNIYYWNLQSSPRVARRVEGTPKQHISWLAFLKNFESDAVLLSPWDNGGVYRIAFGGEGS